MNVIFYNNKSKINVINKNLEEIKTLEFNFKNDSNILYPNLILKNYSGGNYCYIPELNRYYYIDTIDLISGDLYNIKCSVDVLKSYHKYLKDSKFYSTDGVLETVPNQIDYNNIYDINKFILILGG